MRSIFILSGLTFTFSLMLNAQTIYVDINNNTGIEDGTEAHPFNTIKEGIIAASCGNTVFIKVGTYVPDESWSGYDQCVYLKAGVKLMGEGADKTIIDGYIVDIAVSNLSINLEKIMFKEFHFARGTIAGPFPEQNVIKDCNTSLISIKHGAGIPVNDTTLGSIYGFSMKLPAALRRGI